MKCVNYDIDSDYFLIKRQLRDGPNLTYPTILLNDIVEMSAIERWILYQKLNGVKIET